MPEQTVILTNEIKKGERVKQRNGWEAKMLDNMRGNIRVAEVYGDFTESGSIYMHDVTHVLRDGKWLPVTHTPKQLEMRELLDGMGW